MKVRVKKFLSKFKFAIYFTIIYILTIFGFSFIYMGIGDQFYHSTVQYEADVDKAYIDIKSEIQSVVLKAFHEGHDHHTKYLDDDEGWMLYEGDLLVDRFSSEGNRLTIYLTAYIINGNNPVSNEDSTSFVQTNTRFTLEYEGLSIFHENEDIREDSFIYKDIELRDLEALGYSNFNVYKIFNSDDSKRVQLKLPYKFIEKLNAYDMSLNGFPSGIQGNFFRMLYLSMVTITTLGYGDIVPITDSARILIGVESVLGIVIIGWLATSLFNAFAKEKG